MATNSNKRKSNNYEEARKQRVQDNLKRFENLGILKISKSLSEVTNSGKKSQQRLGKPQPKRSLDMLELRRSSRARNPISSYSDEQDIGLPSLCKRSRKNSSWTSYLARPVAEVKTASYEERIHAIKGAEMLQSKLQSGHPSFIKSMVRSHVYSCFWLGLPSQFCKDHLPLKELKMVLEDENGSEYDTIYIGSRAGLSGGWRGFALDHKLDDGDALVFELTEPTRFKVYIVKTSNPPNQDNGTDIIGKKVKSVTDKKTINPNENGGIKLECTGKSKKAIVNENGGIKLECTGKSKKAIVNENGGIKLELTGKSKKAIEVGNGGLGSISEKPKQKKGGVVKKSKVTKEKIVEKGNGSVSQKLQKKDDAVKLLTRCGSKKLFRKKVH